MTAVDRVTSRDADASLATVTAAGAPTITVSWSGDDPSTGSGQVGAGVAHYDVQVRQVLRCALR